MFGKNNNIKTANETIATLTTQLDEANSQIATLKQTISNFEITKTEYSENVELLKKEHAAKIETLTKEHSEKIALLEKTSEETKNSVMKEVSQKITALGIPEDTIKISDAGNTIKSKYIITKIQ